MKTNAKARPITTHEGGTATRCNAEQQLRRSVMACLLWEDSFYEDGQSIADRIRESASKLPLNTIYNIAIEAAEQHYLRHVPLFLTVVAAGLRDERSKIGKHENSEIDLSDVVFRVVRRADSITELCSLYWKLDDTKRNDSWPRIIQVER